MAEVYTSKIDTWLAAVLISAMAVSLIAFFFALLSGSKVALFATLPALLTGFGLPLWLMSSTNYRLSDTSLLVKSGPFKWVIPIKDISNIIPTSNALSSPALSLDRLRIEYGKGKFILNEFGFY